MKFATKAVHLFQESDPLTGSVCAPIYQTSTFEQEAPGEHQGYDYARTNNPTRQRLEQVLAGLEGARYCAVYASGLAAENAILQAFLGPQDEIIVPTDVYGGTYRLLHQVFQPKGVVVRQVDFSDLNAVERAINTHTKLVWLETPTNPRLLIYDIAAIAALTHRSAAKLVVDNTFATPVFQLPLELGADIVVHSVTKYLAGHSDVIQGAVLANDPELFAPIKFLQNACGAVPGPFDCWLTLRGVKTLELRVRKHAENADRIARALVDHPAVRAVHFPGLATHPGHDIARRQMTGFGGIVSIELDADIDAVRKFVSSLRYFVLGESLGGVKSLVCHPAAMTHKSIPAEVRERLGLSDSLVRLSPGIEDADDLIEDLIEGLDSLVSHRAGTAALALAAS
ncbi:MAG: trans-sulfuration enzyme family protein [Phycisphaerae bacterium]